jgi:DNA helicase-2/ATP-dependent DNA helicase PcrA
MARHFVIKRDPDADVLQTVIPYADELNAQQLDVVRAPGGATLVVAGAGTGKTRTLVYRLAWLVEHGTPPEQIVLLTFTRRASREMLARASMLLDGRCNQVRGGTFHAFGVSILRQYAPVIGWPSNFTILDASDAADVIDVLRGALPKSLSRKRFPKKRTLQAIISAVRSRGASLSDILQNTWPQFVSFEDEISALAQAYAAYKQQHGLMDYDDLLIQTLVLLREHDDIRRSVAGRCRHVLVDEYQDTNPAQAALVAAFSSVHGNVMAVGDDAQSIYGFRGADLRNILTFEEQFPGARLLKLEQNYRSTQPILDLANHVLARAHRKHDKQLFTERQGGVTPVFVAAQDERLESRFVAQQVLALREEGVELNQMAVLFRNGFNSYNLEVELNRMGIPFVKYGGLKLSDAAHVKDVLAHIRVMENPQDAVSWNRILQLLEGIGPKTAHRLLNAILAEPSDTLSLDRAYLSDRYADQLTALFNLLRSGRSGKNATPADELERVLAYYEPILKRVYFEDHPKRQQDLDALAALAASFTDRMRMLESMALDPVELTAMDVEEEGNDELPLTLSTIHSAKGLEFKVVFVIQALDGVLPSARAVGDIHAIDEELRLMYVAITRAADELYVSYPMLQARRFDGQYFTSPTRFLQDVPSALLEPGSLVEAES